MTVHNTAAFPLLCYLFSASPFLILSCAFLSSDLSSSPLLLHPLLSFIPSSPHPSTSSPHLANIPPGLDAAAPHGNARALPLGRLMPGQSNSWVRSAARFSFFGQLEKQTETTRAACLTRKSYTLNWPAGA
jgi:hypothetical protein